MSEKRFELAYEQGDWWAVRDGDITLWKEEVVGLLNEQQTTINKLTDEKEYWKNKAMTLLFQVRRLTPRMTDAEVKEFSKELENE